MAFCGCGGIQLIGNGGATCGGSADVSIWSIGGGTTCGGSANVSMNRPNDMFASYYWLDDDGPTYIDHSPNGFDGTGNTEKSNGVACLSSQGFNIIDDEQQFISLPYDGLSNQPFSVSMWVKLISKFKTRTFYSRGYDYIGNRWSFNIGHSYINHIVASVRQEDESTVDVYSDIIDTDQWHHIAASYTGTQLQLFINGYLESEDTATILTTTNGGFIGSLNKGSFPQCYIQDLRVYPEAKNEDWWYAEKMNYCSPTFVTVGSVSIV